MMSGVRRGVLTVTAVLGLAAAAAAQPWVEAEKASALLREGKNAEAAEAFSALAKANEFDGWTWNQYGFALHGAKRYEEALVAWAKAESLGYARPAQLYNMACALTLLGRKDEGLAMLERALKARFAEQETLENDTDMDALRDDPRFAALTGLTKGLKEPPAQGREAGWAWDLDFFLRRMEQMHWDLYARVPREMLRSEVERLKRDIPSLTDSQARVRLRRITAMVGDGHTASRLNAEGEQRRILPVHMFAFTDGVHIIGAAPEGADLVGAKVLGVGSMNTEDVLTAVRPYISVDNDMGYVAGGPVLMGVPAVLHAIGATPDESGAELLIQRPGAASPERVRVDAVDFPAGHPGALVPSYTYLHDKASDDQRAMFLREAEQPNWIAEMPEHKAVYFRFWTVTNTHAGTLKEFAERVFEAVDRTKAEHLVIDMRFNGGGNTYLVRPLLYGLVGSEAVNRRGHLWVIIGRNTFSAAQNTVNFLDIHTEAVFVGEPTGSSPCFVGESTWFLLPHSRTRVFCSSRYWQQMDSTDGRTWVQPDIAAQMSFADYAAGKDPSMDSILKWITPVAPGSATSEPK